MLDVEGTQVLLGGFDAGTRLWETSSDTVTRVSRRFGYEGDLSADVLASYTTDPYDGGCTVVSSVTRPAKRVWTWCNDRVDTFNADGTRMATIDILSDGIGPGRVTARTVTGKAVGRYVVNRGWFGELTFETPTALLLETHGPRKSATVRCVTSDCERASDMTATEFPRLAA